MGIKSWSNLLVLGVLLGVGTVLPAADAPLGSGGISAELDFQGQLEKGLRARRPVEFAYIKQIVTLVDQGKLPRSLVDSTFGWARHKRNRQLQYFQFALQARARDLGYPTPDLADQAVGNGH